MEVEDFILATKNQNIQYSEQKVFKKSTKIYTPLLKKQTSKNSRKSNPENDDKQILIEFNESDNLMFNRAPKITYIDQKGNSRTENLESTFFETVNLIF